MTGEIHELTGVSPGRWAHGACLAEAIRNWWATEASPALTWKRRDDERYPCSSTCTHDDAAKPGHPERVKAQSRLVREALGMPESVATSAKSLAAGYVRLSDTATLFGARAEAPTDPTEIARREGFNEGAEVMAMAGVVPSDPVGVLAKQAGAKPGREVASYRCGYEQACDDMRAACWEAVQAWAQARGLTREESQSLKAAIEGAAP